MPVAPFVALVGQQGGAVSGGSGFYDPRSWLLGSVMLALVAAFGWLRGQAARQPRRGWLPVTAERIRTTGHTAPGHHTPQRPVAPDDDEEFLRRLDRRNRPR